MPVISFPQVASGLSTEQLADLVARLVKEVAWLSNGNIDSANVRNIAGYNVDRYTLKHESGIVGMSGADPTTATAIRFWSGNADPTVAPFRVQQDGTLFSTKGNIGGWVIGANSLSDVAGKVGFSVDATGAAPYLRIWAGNTTPASAGFRVYDDGSAFASNLSITGGSISVTTDVTIGNKLNLSSSNFGNGIIWGTSGIQIYIDPAAGTLRLESPTGGVYIEGARLASTKADKSNVTKTVYVAATSGAAATTPMTITNGVVTA